MNRKYILILLMTFYSNVQSFRNPLMSTGLRNLVNIPVGRAQETIRNNDYLVNNLKAKDIAEVLPSNDQLKDKALSTACNTFAWCGLGLWGSSYFAAGFWKNMGIAATVAGVAWYAKQAFNPIFTEFKTYRHKCDIVKNELQKVKSDLTNFQQAWSALPVGSLDSVQVNEWHNKSTQFQIWLRNNTGYVKFPSIPFYEPHTNASSAFQEAFITSSTVHYSQVD